MWYSFNLASKAIEVPGSVDASSRYRHVHGCAVTDDDVGFCSGAPSSCDSIGTGEASRWGALAPEATLHTTGIRTARPCMGPSSALVMSRTHFLNVDLDLRSAVDLTELARALEPDALTLMCGPVDDGYRASFEIAGHATDAASTVRRLVALVNALPPRARGLWDQATRDFSIGLRAGSQPSTFELGLPPDVVQLVAALGASLSVAIYVEPRE
jgi:hypothetical protein